MAQKAEQAIEIIKKQIQKLGNTPFFSEQVDIRLSAPYFMPLATINELRRCVINKLLEERECNRPIQSGGIKKNDVQYPEHELTFLGNVANEKAIFFYKRHGVQVFEKAAETGLNMVGRKLMTTRHCIKYELGLCAKDKSVAKHQEPLYLLDENGNIFPLRFRCNHCEMDIFFKKI